MRVDKFPDAGTKVQASEFLITSGGQAGNAAVAVARLGGRVRFAGPLGAKNDEFAGRILESLMREKIDCSGAIRVPGAISSVSLILVDAGGEKTIATLNFALRSHSFKRTPDGGFAWPIWPSWEAVPSMASLNSILKS